MHLNEIEQLTKAHEKQVTELENQISKLQVGIILLHVLIHVYAVFKYMYNPCILITQYQQYY